MGHKIDSAYYHKKGCGDVKDPAQKGRCEGFVDQCIATLAKIGDMDKSVYQLTPEKGSPVGGMDFDRCISFAKTMSTDKKPGQVKIAPEKKEEPGKKVEPEKKVPVVKKDPPKAGAGKETGAPKIDKEYFYNKGCSTVAKKPVEYGRCKGFVDQCIGTLEKTGDRDKSVYKQVADTGVAYYKMDFDVCISRASMMSAYGPPAPQKKFDSAKPGVKVEKNPVASHSTPVVSLVEELPPLGPGPNEIKLRLSHFESEYLKHKAFHFRKFTSNIQGEISKIHLYENPSKFFKGVLDIHIDGSTSPKRFSGMGVSSDFLIDELRQMKSEVKAGIAHNALHDSAQVQQIKGKIYHLFDVVDGKVPDETANFTPSLENMLGFRSRAHARKILDNCVAIQVTYAPASGLSNFVVDYQSASGGHYKSRVADIVINVFKQ